MGNICPQEVVLQLKACFLYLDNVFALKRYARFKDVHSFLRRAFALRRVFALRRCVRFKVYQSLSRDFYIVLSCVPASSRVTASK